MSTALEFRKTRAPLLLLQAQRSASPCRENQARSPSPTSPARPPHRQQAVPQPPRNPKPSYLSAVASVSGHMTMMSSGWRSLPQPRWRPKRHEVLRSYEMQGGTGEGSIGQCSTTRSLSWGGVYPALCLHLPRAVSLSLEASLPALRLSQVVGSAV